MELHSSCLTLTENREINRGVENVNRSEMAGAVGACATDVGILLVGKGSRPSSRM